MAFPATELICIAIVACTVFKHAGKVTFKLDDWLKINDDFGKMPTLERAFHSPKDAQIISDEVINFCKRNKFNPKVSNFAGVVTEELLSNVVIHGVKSIETCSSYMRVTFDRHLHIRIYDDNREFNPRKEMKKIESEPAPSGEEKIGLRLVKSITDRYGSFDYQNTAGINTSIVELRC
ncbi:MAG: ATP-binding protein [Selenomonadaceae bacterium]|nr:ATP-binding protein [Selenomonadaceae bacterium]